MRHCIESILPGGEDVEILIVDDGSKDDTAAIADEYAEKYPTIVKAIHQENGGHGEAVNAGIRIQHDKILMLFAKLYQCVSITVSGCNFLYF